MSNSPTLRGSHLERSADETTSTQRPQISPSSLNGPSKVLTKSKSVPETGLVLSSRERWIMQGIKLGELGTRKMEDTGKSPELSVSDKDNDRKWMHLDKEGIWIINGIRQGALEIFLRGPGISETRSLYHEVVGYQVERSFVDGAMPYSYVYGQSAPMKYVDMRFEKEYAVVDGECHSQSQHRLNPEAPDFLDRSRQESTSNVSECSIKEPETIRKDRNSWSSTRSDETLVGALVHIGLEDDEYKEPNHTDLSSVYTDAIRYF